MYMTRSKLVCRGPYGQGSHGLGGIMLHILHEGMKVRHRSKLVDGQMQRVRQQLEQRAIHSLPQQLQCGRCHELLSGGSGCLSKAEEIYVARHRLFAASLSACVTNAYQAWRQVHALTSAEYPQNQLKLDLAQSLFQMMRELRAGRSSRRPSEERSEKE
jgi:hypothetical protein